MHPVIVVEGRCLPEVWEKSILELWNKGVRVRTEYKNDSKDCTMLAIIKEPLSEPRIHKAGLMVGKLSQLEEYVDEVCDGIHDKYVTKGAWSYTYHERMCFYEVCGQIVDQISYVLDKLTAAPYSRRAQAITWKPWVDAKIEDPPCLQRVWLRIYGDNLVMETCWRSRDAMKAAFMNIYALTRLQARLAQELSKRLGKTVTLGEYVDFSNSYHIYEPDFAKAEGLVKRSQETDWTARVWTTNAYKELVAKEAKREPPEPSEWIP